MRNGNQRGGRDKRMFNHMSKALDRSGDVLHQVRGGGSRINTHTRGPPTGPRTGQGRLPRNNNTNNVRAANIQHGLANMGAAGPQGWMMQGQQPNQMPNQMPNEMHLVAMLEQQNQMMLQLSQQLMNGQNGQNNKNNNGNFSGQRGRGKSLFARVHDPHRNNRRGGHHNGAGKQEGEEGGDDVEGEDTDMSGGKQEAPQNDDAVCKYNLWCTNKECKFAHQSPAAPPGATIDVNDVCSFGAACKNRKCVARHPSPAQKTAHQSEQICKFFPNCQNSRCPFKHLLPCRNGAECTTPNCKFHHIKIKCKFNPCLNPQCVFTHDVGQQGGFKDKVWTAESTEEHVSDRKFVGDQGENEEYVAPEDEMRQEGTAQDAEVIG